MENKTLVILEGQQHWVDDAIAQNDDLLRQLFSTLSPAYAEAEIKRSNSRIEIAAKKGTKGTSSPIEQLLSEPIALNPGIQCWSALQQLELRLGIEAQHAGAIASEIETALSQSEQWQNQIQYTLQKLSLATTNPIVPLGF